jgi:hypothetical protein
MSHGQPDRRPITPRKPPLGFDGVDKHWFLGSPVATQIANGVNLLFPAGERFFVRSVNHYLDTIDDPALEAQVRGFFGQEGRHANAHEQYFDAMRAQGYDVDGFLRIYEKIAFGVIEKLCPPALNLAGTAAAEHYTAIMAAGALENDVFAGVDPHMRDLLLWHAAEEIEHKAVAFDVLKQVNPSYALRMAGLALATVNLGAWWVAGTLVLLRQDGMSLPRVWRELRKLRAARGDKGILQNVFARGIREYLRRDFHPNDHDNYQLARAYLARAGLDGGGKAAA